MRNLNILKIANVLSVLVIAVLLVMPLLTSAQYTNPAAPGTEPAGVLQGTDKISTLIIQIISILLAVAGLIAVIFLIVGGFRYITAGGNEESSEAAKKTITNAIIGIVIIILAFVIVRVIANALIKGSSGGV